jgi:hypothetical protein
VSILRYRTGEEIKKDDRIVYHGVEGRIELVALNLDDPEQEWYVREYGGGVMVANKQFGRVFIHADQLPEDEDLELVARADSQAES